MQNVATMPNIEQVLRYIQTLFPGQLVLYSPQVAQVIGRSEKALQHLIARGQLPWPGKQIGSRWCVDIFRVAEWLAVDSSDVAAPAVSLDSEPPKKPTRPRRSSQRQSLGTKLLEMRQSAALSIRRMGQGSDLVDELVRGLLQPLQDDELSVSVVEGDVAHQEMVWSIAAAGERIADLRRSVVGEATLRVVRGLVVIYECVRATATDWRVTIDADSQLAAWVGFVANQSPMPVSAADCIPRDWLAQQSPDVRHELFCLSSFGVEAVFFDSLADAVAVVPSADLIPLLYDAWTLPTKRVFELALAHQWSAKQLTQAVNDAELGLSDDAVRDFEDFFPVHDDPAPALSWLREKAYIYRLGQSVL